MSTRLQIKTGDLRDLITIRRQTTTKNSRGGLTVAWSTLAKVWAEVKSISGREAVIGEVLQGVSTFRITVRYRDDIRTDDQILWGSRELNILSAEDAEGIRRWLTIIASSGTAKGA